MTILLFLLKNKTFWVGLGISLVILFSVYSVDKISSLKQQNAIFENNILAAQHTLEVYKDSTGATYASYAFITTTLKDSIKTLNSSLVHKTKEILSLSNVIVSIQSEHSQGTSHIDSNYNSTIIDTSGFIKVSGNVFVNVKDSTINYHLVKWVDPFNMKVYLLIEKDNSIVASIKFDNSELKISSLQTIMENKFSPIADKAIGKSIWDRLGVYGNIGLTPIGEVEVGLVVRPFTIGWDYTTKNMKVGVNTTFKELWEGL